MPKLGFRGQINAGALQIVLIVIAIICGIVVFFGIADVDAVKVLAGAIICLALAILL